VRKKTNGERIGNSSGCGKNVPPQQSDWLAAGAHNLRVKHLAGATAALVGEPRAQLPRVCVPRSSARCCALPWSRRQIKTIEAEQANRWRPAGEARVAQLARLRAGPARGALGVGERGVRLRHVSQSREVGSCLGSRHALASGGERTEQGIRKAGNKRAKVDAWWTLAWSWLAYQPNSV